MDILIECKCRLLNSCKIPVIHCAKPPTAVKSRRNVATSIFPFTTIPIRYIYAAAFLMNVRITSSNVTHKSTFNFLDLYAIYAFIVLAYSSSSHPRRPKILISLAAPSSSSVLKIYRKWLSYSAFSS